MAADYRNQGQLLQQLCTAEQYTEMHNFLSNTQRAKPSDLEGRSKIATDLLNIADKKFEAGDMNNTIFFRIAGMHYLDFSQDDFSKLSLDEQRQVHHTLVTELRKLSVAMRNAKRVRQAITATDLAFDMLDDLSQEDGERLKIELFFNRALAKGVDRDFEGAREEAHEILRLSPEHAQAKQIIKNCRVAIRRERGPRDSRWTQPLDFVPEGDKEWFVMHFQVFSVVVAIIGILIVQYARYYGFSSEE